MLLKIADFYYPTNTSTLISTIFFFGTLLVSTLLSALWSHNFAVLFGLIALYLMLKKSKKDIFLCAVCLFIAYLCRPTLSLLAVFLLIYLSMTDFKKGIKLAAYLAAALTVFYFFCAHLYSTGLPPYYLPQRLSNTNLMHGILGNTFSPSRGLFIFCPFIGCLLLFKPKNIFKHWWTLGVLWPMSHFFIVARFPVWWGAMSFGPRLLVDCMPGVFLFCLSFWPNLQHNKFKLFLLTLSILFSVYVNTWQGRFNIDAAITWHLKYLNGFLPEKEESFFRWEICQAIYPKST